MSLPDPWFDLERDNALLRRQNAQLQNDLIAVQADFNRLQQRVERLCGRAPLRPPNPLSGGR